MQRSARFLLAGLSALALGTAVPAVAAVSPAVGKALNTAASASKSGNSSAAIAAIKQAEAAASTSEEKTKTAQMAAYVYTRAGRYAEAAKALEATGASPNQIAPLYYQAGQYDKAIAVAKKGSGEGMQILIAQADTKLGRHKEAVAAYQALIKANGPKPIYLENLAGAQYKAGDKAGYLATTEKLIRVDSSPARWNTLLVNFRQNPMRPEAKLALVQNQAGVAQAALAKGGTSTDAMGQKMAKAAADKAAAAAAEAPKLSASPSTALRGANAYFGMGQYAKAIEVYSKVIAANGTDADYARVFKGIAQLKSGQVAPAKASFAAVGDKSGMKDIANLWGLFASTRGAIPAAAPAAAAPKKA